MARTVLLITVALLCIKCTSKPIAKNHIFFIIDGMGPAHITGARLYKGGPEARLSVEKMPYTGLVRTYSTNNFVTDSAASATALASGTKTYNHAIGVSDAKKDPSGRSRPLTTIVDRAQQSGKAIGIISTARITHATPAAYYAHATHREMEESIAEQLLESNIDLAIGGGRRFFISHKDGGARKDEKNLLREFEKKGYRVAQTSEEFKSLPQKSSQKTIALLGEDHLDYDLERLDQPSLAELVDYAIQHLSQNPKGYFLVIEVARVDHASHQNLARQAFGDMLAFDKALERTFLENEKDTLLLVTSDHETGGLALSGYAPYHVATGENLLKNHTRNTKRLSKTHGLVSWASGPGFHSPYRVDVKKKNFQHKATYDSPVALHTAVDVPVMARGPGASKFTGFSNNEEIAHKVIDIMGLKPLKTK